MKLRDACWLWGQTAGTHHLVPEIALPGENRMTPAEGLLDLGIPNVFRVVYQGTPVYPYDAETQALRNAKQVVWSICDQAARGRAEDAEGDLAEVLRQAARYENVSGAVIDDFFARKAHLERYSVEAVSRFRARLKGAVPRPLDLWMVVYTRDLTPEIAPFLKLCDHVSLWTWRAETLPQLPEKLETLERMLPSSIDIYTGCYYWDYGPSDEGRGKPMPDDLMRYQLDLYYELLKSHRIRGVVFCSNCTADIGLHAADMARDWLALHGDETL